MTDAIDMLDAAELLAESLDETAPAAPKLAGPKAPAPKRKPPRPADDPVKAPHGWVYEDGKWRPRRPAGRPAGAKKAPGRVTAAPAAAPGSQAAKQSAATLGRAAAELAEGVGFGLAMLPLPASPLRVRARLQASILIEHAGAIGQAAAKTAPHVPMVERVLSKLAAGSGGAWVVPVALVLGPVVIASVEVWRAPVDETMAKTAEEIERSAFEQMRTLFTAVNSAAASAAGNSPTAADADGP